MSGKRGTPSPGRGELRVVAGRFRGRRIATLPGLEIRPTADRVREALFSILGERVVGARCVDCFAGTGALGIEALSRGADEVLFVESDPKALVLLRENLARLPHEGRARVLEADALAPRRWQAQAFPASVVLADPPYRRGLAQAFAEALGECGALEAGGVLVIEHETELDLRSPRWVLTRRRVYGDTTLSLLVSWTPGKEDM